MLIPYTFLVLLEGQEKGCSGVTVKEINVHKVLENLPETSIGFGKATFQVMTGRNVQQEEKPDVNKDANVGGQVLMAEPMRKKLKSTRKRKINSKTTDKNTSMG